MRRSVRAYFAHLGRRRVQDPYDITFLRFATEQRPKLAFRGRPSPFQLANCARCSQEPLGVANVMHELPYDEKPSIGLKRRGLRAVIAIDRLDQPDRRNLLEVGPIESPAHEASSRSPAEVPICDDRSFTIDEGLRRRRRGRTNARNRNDPPKRRCTKAKSHTQPQLRLEETDRQSEECDYRCERLYTSFTQSAIRCEHDARTCPSLRQSGHYLDARCE